MTYEEVKVYKFASPENHGVDYTWNEFGLSIEITNWIQAFKKLGFKKITREQAEKMFDFEDPMELQNANTYNDTTTLANHINYGLNKTMDDRTLLVFKEHTGRDIRAGYTQNRYMIHDESKRRIMHDLIPILSPELFFRINDLEGEQLVRARTESMGYTTFQKNELDLEGEDINAIAEATEDNKEKVINLQEVLG